MESITKWRDTLKSRMERAVKKGDLKEAQHLVTEEKVDVSDGSYLQGAIEYDHPHVVRYLIEQGADVNTHYGSTFFYAAEHGYLSIVQLLVSRGLDIVRYGERGMGRAITDGRLDIVKYLYSLGVRSCPKKDLHLAAYHDHSDVVSFLLSQGICNDISEDVLEHAIQGGHLDIAVRLYSGGMRLSGEKPYRSIVEAARRGHLNIVKVFLKSSAQEEWMLKTLLEEAIRYGHFDIVRFLVSGGLEPDTEDLIIAVIYKRYEIADYILDEIYNDIHRPEYIDNGRTRRYIHEVLKDKKVIVEGIGAATVLSELISQYY